MNMVIDMEVMNMIILTADTYLPIELIFYDMFWY